MLRTQRRSLSAQIVKPVFTYPLLTVVYTLSGKLGLMLAVPPGYASPIFPAAGIAVAATLIRGRATLPWIFLGSLLLNLWAGYSIGHQLDAASAAAAIIIAAASMLQAAIGGAMLRRAIGYPAPLDNGRDISRFLLLSPVSCLTSATLSLAGLSVLGVVARPIWQQVGFPGGSATRSAFWSCCPLCSWLPASHEACGAAARCR